MPEACPACNAQGCVHLDATPDRPRSYACLACGGVWPISHDGVQRCYGCGELLLAPAALSDPDYPTSNMLWHLACLEPARAARKRAMSAGRRLAWDRHRGLLAQAR